ncbi:helix-turn-helix transcriptional regulator [Candidatus Saccharibacteria bacterium]|nr:MAG: helix-turn-helix transcriptional regulator [Candidatus Saccharibacteria bacterium]
MCCVMIYNRLATLRTMHGLSRQELADKVGVNYQTIGFIERGDYSPSLELGFAIASVFHVRIDDIFSTNVFQPMLGEVKHEPKIK